MHWDVEHTIKIGGLRDTGQQKRKGSNPTKFAHKKAQLKDYILARSLFFCFGCVFCKTHIIGTENYNGKCDIRVMFEFLDDSAAFIRFFVENDRIKFELSKKPGYSLFAAMVVSMNYKHIASILLERSFKFLGYMFGFQSFFLQFRNSGLNI